MLRGFMWKGILFTSLASSGVALAADDPTVPELLKPYQANVLTCANEFLMPFYKEVFEEPAGATITVQKAADPYDLDATLENRHGIISYAVLFSETLNGNSVPKLSLYVEQDGRIDGAVYDKDGYIIVYYQSDTGFKMPMYRYQTTILSYEIDRFGRIINVVQRLDSVTVSPEGETTDRITFHNADTEYPVGFGLSGLAAYHSCLQSL